MIVWKISHNIAHKIRPDWTFIAATSWNHTKLAPGWNFGPVFKTEVKSSRGEISPRVERVTTYSSFLIERGNFIPGRNITYDGPLNLKCISDNRKSWKIIKLKGIKMRVFFEENIDKKALVPSWLELLLLLQIKYTGH